ncbi:MAG: preprotein translocase subunit YajC [Pseudomonadota bacterium]
MDATQLLFPVLLLVIFYFFLIRPQQKRVKEHQTMVDGLRRGDEIITQGGLIAKVTKVKDEAEIEAELSQGVKVRIMRQTVASVRSKTEPADS